MSSPITPADAFRLLLHARLMARYSRRFKFADKITSYHWFWYWKSQGTPRPVHAIADETLKALCKHVRNGTIKLLSRSQIPPVYIDPMHCSLGELHVFNQTLTIDAQSASPACKYEHVFCDESDVMKVIRDASKDRSLLAATEKDIRDVIADCRRLCDRAAQHHQGLPQKGLSALPVGRI